MTSRNAVGGGASLDQSIARLFFGQNGHPSLSDIPNVAAADSWLSSNGVYSLLNFFVSNGGQNIVLFNELNVSTEPQYAIDQRILAYLSYAIQNAYFNGGNRLLYTLFPGPSGLLPNAGTFPTAFAPYWDRYDLRAGGPGTQQTFGQVFPGNVDQLVAGKTMLWHNGSGVFDRVALHCYASTPSNFSSADPTVNEALRYLQWMHDSVESTGFVYVTEAAGNAPCTDPGCSDPNFNGNCGDQVSNGPGLAAFESSADQQFGASGTAGTFLQAIYGYILETSNCASTTGGRDAIGANFITGSQQAKTLHPAVCGHWVPLSNVGAPSPRFATAGIGTHDALLVWGGYASMSTPHDLGNGGRYLPGSDSWLPMSSSGAPSPRHGHVAVWTGSEMLVWGGWNDWLGALNDGGRYDPSSDSWAPMSGDGAPDPFYSTFAGVWTGKHLIIWGFRSTPDGPEMAGALYDPEADNWAPMASDGQPSPRIQFSATWSGTEMLVWGGSGQTYPEEHFGVANGARYDPIADTWKPMSDEGAPSPRFAHAAVWTGHELLITGGHWFGEGSAAPLDGGAYDPSVDGWRPIAPSPRIEGDATAVWNGRVMLEWNGEQLMEYRPITDEWIVAQSAGTPSPRTQPSMVWIGAELLLWGGQLPGHSPTDRGDGARCASN